MKLNLVPVTVSRGAKTRGAWILAIGWVIVCGVVCVFMIISSQAALKEAREKVKEERPKANYAYNVAKQAETDILEANASVRNISLANEMIARNKIYPDFYQGLFKYIPPFFRVIQIRATPAGAGQVSVTMSGTLTTYQQYADLMLALMRDPNVTSVSRAGFQKDDLYVPALQPVDQAGRPRKPSEGPIPDDPLQRLAYFQDLGAARQTGYTGQGNFGSGEPSARFAKPGDSQITVTLTMLGDLMVPDPAASLQQKGPAAAAGGATGGGMNGEMGGMAPGGMPGMTPGGMPGGPGGAMPAPGGASPKQGD